MGSREKKPNKPQRLKCSDYSAGFGPEADIDCKDCSETAGNRTPCFQPFFLVARKIISSVS